MQGPNVFCGLPLGKSLGFPQAADFYWVVPAGKIEPAFLEGYFGKYPGKTLAYEMNYHDSREMTVLGNLIVPVYPELVVSYHLQNAHEKLFQLSQMEESQSSYDLTKKELLQKLPPSQKSRARQLVLEITAHLRREHALYKHYYPGRRKGWHGPLSRAKIA